LTELTYLNFDLHFERAANGYRVEANGPAGEATGTFSLPFSELELENFLLKLGHTGRGKNLAVSVSGGLRALPTLGALTLFGLWLGIGLAAPIIALVILAIPPLLAGAYAGFESVDRRTIDAARAMGMREGQIVGKVELPLGMPIVVGGIRSATLQIIATATLAAYIADEGLGRFIFEGLKTRNYAEMLGGSILVIILALVVDGCFALTQRLVVPAGVRAARSTELRSRPTRSRAALGQPINEGNRS